MPRPLRVDARASSIAGSAERRPSLSPVATAAARLADARGRCHVRSPAVELDRARRGADLAGELGCPAAQLGEVDAGKLRRVGDFVPERERPLELRVRLLALAGKDRP